jgi:hypothetical protein
METKHVHMHQYQGTQYESFATKIVSADDAQNDME